MTEDALIEALRAAQAVPVSGGEGLPLSEIVAATGISAVRLRELLRRAIAAGSVRPSVRYISNLAGRRQSVPSYTLVKITAPATKRGR